MTTTKNRTFTCRTVRLTRLTINSFFEKLDIFLRITKEFGLDAEDPGQAVLKETEVKEVGEREEGRGEGREGGTREEGA